MMIVVVLLVLRVGIEGHARRMARQRAFHSKLPRVLLVGNVDVDDLGNRNERNVLLSD